MKAGRRNLITDVAGVLVGNASHCGLKSGCTVFTMAEPFVCSVDVMGGAPGTRETDLLAPDKSVEKVDALVLGGGSAFGLEAAAGVVDGLRAAGRGFRIGPALVPIVPAAILFDLLNGGNKNWQDNPYRELGMQALASASAEFDIGSAGAGYGATTANLKGGLGSASVVLDGGVSVGALVAVNALGGATPLGAREFWAAPWEIGDEFGGCGPVRKGAPFENAAAAKFAALNRAGENAVQGGNTTIAIVATDARLSKAQARRMAVAAQDGIARALVPSHTPFDGDLVFGVSTGARPVDGMENADMLIGHAAATSLSRAIARAIFHARPEAGDIFPTWQEQWA